GADVRPAREAEGQLRVMREERPGRADLRPRRVQEQHRRRRPRLGEKRVQLQRRRVHPLQVLEHGNRGLEAGRTEEPRDQRGKELLPLRLGAEPQRRVAIRDGQSEERSHERQGRGERQPRAGEALGTTSYASSTTRAPWRSSSTTAPSWCSRSTLRRGG